MAKMDTTPEQATPVDLTSVLARLDSLESENKLLKSQVNPENMFKKAKERYEWPRNYSYKLWGDVPVLSYKSVKKDTTKDFTFKDHNQVLQNNQFLELTLADEKIVKVDVHEFNNNFSRSEKLPAEPITDGVTVTGYKYKDSTYGEFIVSAKLIN